MDTIKINVDGQSFHVQAGSNLFSSLRSHQLLNSLCYHESIKSERNCGLCLVEVENEITGKKELISSCQKIVSSPLKVNIKKSTVASVRQSILSLWLHHFYGAGVYTSTRLLKKLALIFKTTIPLSLRLKHNKSSSAIIEKWSPHLQYNRNLCIGCGLCVDFVKQSQKLKILELQIKDGQYLVTKDGILDVKLEKSLSLVCPTEALSHSTPHSFKSDVFVAAGSWNITYKDESFVVRAQNREVFIEPLETRPFLSETVYKLIQRYHPDFLFNSILHFHSNLASLKCTWYIGENMPQSTLDCIEELIQRRREKIMPLNLGQSISLQSHSLAPKYEDKVVLVLGPDDELGPEDILKYKSVGMVVLSRFNQWHGRPMSDYPEIIWAPHPDVLEFSGDKRFPRHFAHTLKRLSL